MFQMCPEDYCSSFLYPFIIFKHGTNVMIFNLIRILRRLIFSQSGLFQDFLKVLCIHFFFLACFSLLLESYIFYYVNFIFCYFDECVYQI